MMAEENRDFLNELSRKLKYKHELEKLKSLELERVRSKWYTAKLVLAAAQDACAQQPSTQAMETLAVRMTSAECDELVSVNSCGSQSGLLGIPTALTQTPPSADYKTDDVRKMVLDQIHKKLLSISLFYQPSAVGSGTNLLKAKASQLHKVVEKDKECIVANRLELQRLTSQRILLLQKLQQAHSKNLHLLDTLLRQHCLTTVPKEASQTTDHIAAKSEALAAKIALIGSELYADTYTPKMVKELSAVRNQLDTKLSKAEENLKFAEQEYVRCLSAGTEFQILAKQYTELKNDIETRSWALNELKVAKQHKT